MLGPTEPQPLDCSRPLFWQGLEGMTKNKAQKTLEESNADNWGTVHVHSDLANAIQAQLKIITEAKLDRNEEFPMH